MIALFLKNSKLYLFVLFYFLTGCYLKYSVTDLNSKNESRSVLKIQQGSNQEPLVINEGSILVVYFVLSSPLKIESKFNLILKGANSENVDKYFNLNQVSFTIPAGQTSSHISISTLNDTIYHTQTRWTLQFLSQTTELQSDDTLEFYLNDDDTNSNIEESDKTAPNPPTNLSTSLWINSTSESPSLSFTSGIDTQSGIAQHEVKIYDSTSMSDLNQFTSISSGNTVSNLNLINGHTYFFILRAVDKAGNYSSEVTSQSWTVDTTPPTAPSAITTGSVPLEFKQMTPTFTFNASTDVGGSGVSHYLIEILKKSDNSIIKNYSQATVIDTEMHYSESVDFLTSGETYIINVKAVDLAGNQSASAQSGTPWIALVCPSNFIAIPSISPYTTLGFCVAKYEMKIQGQSNGNIAYNSANIADSRPDGTPWVNINRTQSITECQQLGTGFDLMSNSQWQTIARNIELNNTNWTSNVVGTQSVYSGHNDNSPNTSLSITDTSDWYNSTGNSAISGKEQRRVLVIQSGSEIWDFSGNVWEKLKDDNTTAFGVDEYWSQITDISHTIIGTIGGLSGNARYLFGPSTTYSLLSGRGGFGVGMINSSAGGIFRGGGWYSGSDAGIFATNLTYGPGLNMSNLGFRCTYTP